mgnify:FL=1
MTFSLRLTAQDRTIDSLKLALKNANHDTTRCNILYEMIEAENDYKIWSVYNDQLLKLSEKGATVSGPTTSIKIFYLKHLAGALNNIGFLSRNQGDIPKALDYYHRSLKIEEEIKNKEGIAISLSNIGVIYNYQGDIPKALDYFHKSLNIQEEIKDKLGIATSLNFIGLIYNNQGNIPKALQHFHRSLKIQEEIKDKQGFANSLNNIGNIYNNQGDIPNALEYFQMSLKIQEEIKDKDGIAGSLNSIANAMLQNGRVGDALDFATRSLQTAKELGYPENINAAANTLKSIYKKKNNYKDAFEMYELEIQMRDSISNTETKKASIKKQFQYQYEKKAAADSVKNAEEQKVKNAQLTAQQAQLKQEKTQRFALYGGLLLVVAFLGFVFNRFKITQKQKVIIEEQKVLVDNACKHLEEKNKEVMDSIRYAKRIQTALMTNEKYITKALEKLSGNRKA